MHIIISRISVERGEKFNFMGQCVWACTNTRYIICFGISGREYGSIPQDIFNLGRIDGTEICDRIWENPPYGIRTMRVFSSSGRNPSCPDFVIYMSNNPSTNLPSSTETNCAI